MNCTISKEVFGQTLEGEDVYKFTFTNENAMRVSVLNFGCVVYEIRVPDKDGNVDDVSLGFAAVEDYEVNLNNFGVLGGRTARRIGEPQLTLFGQTLVLDSLKDPSAVQIVEDGGGCESKERHVWDWDIKDNSLILRYIDPEGNEGMPGQIYAYVTCSLSNDNVFTMDIKASTTEATPIDIGSHFMVNLAGHDAGDTTDHVIKINSDRFLDMDHDYKPSGKILPVEGTVMDFRQPRATTLEVIESLVGDQGFNHVYCVGERGIKKFVARLEHPASRRFMEVYSTNSVVFVYNNFLMPLLAADTICKDNVTYSLYGGVELLPQAYPDSINQPNFPSSIVQPGETYHEVTSYRFGVAD